MLQRITKTLWLVGQPKVDSLWNAWTSHVSGTLGQSWSLIMDYEWSHLMGVLTIVCPLAWPLMVEWWIVIFLQQNLFQCCKKITRQQLVTLETSLKRSIIIISFLTIRYGMRNKRLLQKYSGIGKSLTKGWESCCWHTWIKKLAPGTGIKPYPRMSSMIQYCAMYFKLSLHALKNSDIVSQWSVLMGPICMVNIEGCCWLQRPPMPTIRFCLSPLPLWTKNQGLVGGGF